MNSCNYYINDKKYSLDDVLASEQVSNLSKLEGSKLDTITDLLISLNKEYKLKNHSKLKPGIVDVDLDPDIDITSELCFTTLTFIDSDYFNVDGEAPIFRLNLSEYLDLTKKRLMDSENVKEVEADLYCEKIKKNWDKIAKDAFDLHRIIVSSNSNSTLRHYSGSALNTSFSKVYDLLEPLVAKIEHNILKSNGGSHLLRNINMEANIKNIAEKIIGHIDYLCVKPSGEIEIYNIKTSTQNPHDWGVVKMEKFKYQLALLKKILEFNGIDSRMIRVNLVPVKIKYDDNFENVEEITTTDVITIDLKNFLYSFLKYDNIASTFIDSNVKMEDLQDDSIDKVNRQLSCMLPERKIDLKYNGIKESAKGWIDTNWRSIARAAKNKPGWEIRLPGSKKSIYLSDTKIGSDNQQLLSLVISKEEELFNNSSAEKSTYRIILDIKNSFRNRYSFLSSSVKGVSNSLLAILLNKYFEGKIDSDGKVVEYKWKLIGNLDLLNKSNILLFRNSDTNLIDVVTLTPYDVSSKCSFKHRNNLLGYYLSDMNKYNFTLESNYGNIEAIRTLTLLNEVLPKLNFKPKLGLLKLVGLSGLHQKKGAEFELSLLLPHFDTIVNVVNANNETLKMLNNFKANNISCIDPSESFIQSWREVIAENPNYLDIKDLDTYIIKKIKTDGTLIDGLESMDTIESKIDKLEIIIDKLQKLSREYPMSLNPKKLIELCNNANPNIRSISKLYCAAILALSKYRGDLSISNEEFSLMSEYLLKPQSIPNSNVRTVAYMLLKTMNKIADTMTIKYSPIKKIIKEYYDNIGYTPLENSLVGDLARVFKNLYELDNLGIKTMRFKNPYINENDSNYLNIYERQFLKKILFEFNKIRASMHGRSFEYTSMSDPKLITYMQDPKHSYFDVPLERASTATRRTNFKQNMKEFAQRMVRRFKNPVKAFGEFEENIFEDERKQLLEDISNMLAYNPFTKSELTNSRNNYINTQYAEYGDNYFETNVENLIIDYMEKNIQSVEYNKMLTRTKGILLDIYLKGLADGDEKNIEHTVKTIEDYLAVNVFNISIMEKSSLKIEVFLDPIRRAVSKCYIAANPVGAVRDTLEGLLQNITKSIIKFLTDINPEDVFFGYKEVIKEGPTSPMKISKLNQFNIKYRFSNLDVARISEGQKTGRGGILNAENWAYSTLRGPDYLNRMVLFTAKLKHDGCYNAYTIEDGKLVYNWKLDNRFKEYANNNTKSPEYNKQRSLYLSLLRIFNLENNTKLVEGDALPDAYTLAQIESFKTFADNIYGSYNKSMRAKYENVAIGRNFLVFSTWMNGIVDVYAKLKLISRGEFKWEQLTDTNGLPLYFDKDGLTKTLEEGGLLDCPAMDDVPLMVLGIFGTLKDAFNELRDGGWASFNSNVWQNEIDARNFKRLLSDLFVAILLGVIFKCGVDPAYRDHKKLDSGKNLITNGIIEILYKSSSNCFDGFKGPWTIIDYIGNSTNPATYKLQSKIFNDLGSFLFGDKTMGELLMGSLALPRSLRDTYHMWLRDLKN